MVLFTYAPALSSSLVLFFHRRVSKPSACVCVSLSLSLSLSLSIKEWGGGEGGVAFVAVHLRVSWTI